MCSVVANAEASYIKVVSEQFDRCHGTLLQYVEFLSSAVTPLSAYGQLIPSLEDLVQKYHLEPEVPPLDHFCVSIRTVIQMYFVRLSLQWSKMWSAILCSKVHVEGDARPGTCGLVAKSTIPYLCKLVYFYNLCTSSAQFCLQED